MDSRDFTHAQCEWLHEKFSRMAFELAQISARLEKLEFPDNDLVRIHNARSFDAVCAAARHAHSLCCQGQMGKTSFFINQDRVDGQPLAPPGVCEIG